MQERNGIGAEFSRTIGDPDYLERLPEDTYFAFDGWSTVTTPVGAADQTLVYDVGEVRAVKRNVNRFGYSFFAPGLRVSSIKLSLYALTTFTVLRSEDSSTAQSFQPSLLPIPDGLMPASFLLGSGAAYRDLLVAHLGAAIDTDLGTQRVFDPVVGRAIERAPTRPTSVDLFIGAVVPRYGIGVNTLPSGGVLRVRVGRLLRFVTAEERDSEGRAKDDVAVSFLRVPGHDDLGLSGTRVFGFLDVGGEVDVAELRPRSAWLGARWSSFVGKGVTTSYDVACRASIYRERQVAIDDPLRPEFVPGGRCELSFRGGAGARHTWALPVIYRTQFGWNDRDTLPEVPYTFNMLMVLVNLGWRFDGGAPSPLQRKTLGPAAEWLE